jgi:hypothetical protein
MEIDITAGKERCSINIENQYRVDSERVMGEIFSFGERKGIDLRALNIEDLIPRMIRGVAGCEGGCPADAKGLVREGFGKFRISYIEGGILSAVHSMGEGRTLSIKVFPDFD